MNVLPVNEEFLQQIELLQLLVKNNAAGRFGGNHRSKTFGSSVEFADYRDYMPGDEIKKIDWNVYARFDKLIYKLYFDERQMHTRIYIDGSRSMGYGNSGKGVQAIRIAAALAYISVCDMDKVSVYVIRENGLEEIITDMLGRDRYFGEIVKLNDIVFDGESRISDAVTHSTVGFGDGMSVIISDYLTDNDYETAIDFLASKKRDVVCVQVLDREELNPKSRGKMHFFDSENTDRYYRKNITRDIIAAYKKAVEYATDRIRSYCNSRGGDYILVSSEQSLQEIFFGRLVETGVTK